MNKAYLLKAIAEAGYDVGYGAKLHFATLDIIEKLPGLLGFIGLAVGIYALFVPSLAASHVGAAMVLFGIASVYLGMYQADKQRYDDAGKAFTAQFHRLKRLYFAAQSRSDSADISDLIQDLTAIQTEAVATSLSRQVLFSDWYAHYKFFWQQQIDWIDEQKKFGTFRDRVPFTAWLALLLVVIGGTYWAVTTVSLLSCSFAG
jgi:hypothetical protein